MVTTLIYRSCFGLFIRYTRQGNDVPFDSSWSLGLFAVFSLVLIPVLIPRISSPNLGCCRHSCVSPVRSVAAAAVVFSFFGLGPS